MFSNENVNFSDRLFLDLFFKTLGVTTRKKSSKNIGICVEKRQNSLKHNRTHCQMPQFFSKSALTCFRKPKNIKNVKYTSWLYS